MYALNILYMCIMHYAYCHVDARERAHGIIMFYVEKCDSY